jgi:hypothetical protein
VSKEAHHACALDPDRRRLFDASLPRADFDRRRAEGKRHNAGLICLACRRCDVLHAMIRTSRATRSGYPLLLGSENGDTPAPGLGQVVLTSRRLLIWTWGRVSNCIQSRGT